MKQKVLGTGLSGMVGSRVVELLSYAYDFEDLSLATGVDITHPDEIDTIVSKSSAKWIVHLAAKTDVDRCEQEKEQGTNSEAWKINVEGTRTIIAKAQKYQKNVLYISTDFVFDGQKYDYDETDLPQPINWYGQTKYEGEKIVLQNSKHAVARITYPYRAVFKPKKDFVRTVLHKLSQGMTVRALDDHFFTPTFIDDIAWAVKAIIEKSGSGIYHVVGSQSLTPYDATQMIAQTFDMPTRLINVAHMIDYYKNRAPRPFKLRIKNDRIKSLSVQMQTLSAGLSEIKKQGVVL